MAFDIGAGLAEAGKSVAQTAQAYTLESQKAELEKEKVLLADQLAGVREEKQRGFITSERVATQEFSGGENEKNRANTLAVANIGLEGHKISAGATIAAAQIGATERRYATDKQFETNKNELTERRYATDKAFEQHKYAIDEQIKAGITGASKLSIGDNGEAFSVNPVTKEVVPLKGADGTQLKFRDPEVARAQAELIKNKSSQLTDINRIYVPQIIDLENNIAKLQGGSMSMLDETKQQINEMKGRLKTIRDQFDSERAPLVRDLNAYGEALITKGKLTGATPSSLGVTGVPDPAQFDRRLKNPTAPPPTAAAPTTLKMPTRSLINNPMGEE